MSKHTAKPWKMVRPHELGVGESVIADLLNSNLIIPANRQDLGDIESDQSLIIAAPDMFDALMDTICALECCGKDYDHVLGKAKQAIAKAKGELP